MEEEGEVVRREGGPGVCRKKGAIERLYAPPPADSVVLRVDEMGPLSARSYPGRELVPRLEQGRAGRAKQELELDRNRRMGGYVFGAFRPTTGEALTATYESRSIVTFLDFLEKVEEWVPEGVDRVYAIMDNLRAHRPTTSCSSAWPAPAGSSSSNPSTLPTST